MFGQGDRMVDRMAPWTTSVFSRYCIWTTFTILVAVSFIFVYVTPSISFAHFSSMVSVGSSRLATFMTRKSQNNSIDDNLSAIYKILKVKGVDCPAIFNDSKTEIESAKKIAKTVDTPISDAMYLNMTVDCVAFQKRRGYIMSSLTKEEEEFPLAYSLVVYKDSEMVERLLRSIYRPQNVYCIHVDGKATETFLAAISGIANCFFNVFLSSRRINVHWGQFSVLEPELICMHDLWRYPKWKYFINLTGQEFPLKTNFELVKILTAYNGAVDVATTVKHANTDRWKNTKPPFGLRPVKGSVHIVVNRYYVDFILHNNTAHDLLKWTNTTNIPDETFFAILNANPQLGIRGTYKGEPEHSEIRPFLARFKNWGGVPCAWQRVRAICILTTGDLPLLFHSRALFANKFYLSEDRVAIGCLEERLFNDTISQYFGSMTFNTSYYSDLDFVKNQVM